MSDRKNATGKPAKLLATLDPGAIVYSIGFSPDGKWLAIGDTNDHLKIWDVATQQVIRELRGCAGFFSPQGDTLATVFLRENAQTIVIWDLKQGTEIHRCSGGHLAAVTAVAFSADGTRLATGGRGGQVMVWDTSTGQQTWTPLTNK